MRCADHAENTGEKTTAYLVLIGKTRRKIQLERPRHKWKKNVKFVLNGIECDDVNWIYLAQNRDH
jgi:hypothetical protein